MTLVYERAPAAGEAATHAFVIGVGAYPQAKAGQGALAALRGVPDIPSAGDSAKLVCDWLLRNKDALSAPLGSLELLLSEAAPRPGTTAYAWTNQGDWNDPAAQVDAPDDGHVSAAGDAWVDRIRPGDVAIFYICGHGARSGSEGVVFLSDLNKRKSKPWTHINVVQAALGFKQLANVKAAFFFVDACQELLPRFELNIVNRRDEVAISPGFDAFDPSNREKVALLAGASSGHLGYEGAAPTDDEAKAVYETFAAGLPTAPQVRIGRFTQTLLKALDGAAVRYFGTDLVVYAGDVFVDLKPLYQLRDDWREKLFDPVQMLAMSDSVPIVRPTNPLVPVLMRTHPEDRFGRCEVRVFGDTAKAKELSPPFRGSTSWVAEVTPSMTWHRVVATLHDDATPPAAIGDYEADFLPSRSLYDVRITIQ